MAADLPVFRVLVKTPDGVQDVRLRAARPQVAELMVSRRLPLGAKILSVEAVASPGVGMFPLGKALPGGPATPVEQASVPLPTPPPASSWSSPTSAVEQMRGLNPGSALTDTSAQAGAMAPPPPPQVLPPAQVSGIGQVHAPPLLGDQAVPEKVSLSPEEIHRRIHDVKRWMGLTACFWSLLVVVGALTILWLLAHGFELNLTDKHANVQVEWFVALVAVMGFGMIFTILASLRLRWAMPTGATLSVILLLFCLTRQSNQDGLPALILELHRLVWKSFSLLLLASAGAGFVAFILNQSLKARGISLRGHHRPTSAK